MKPIPIDLGVIRDRASHSRQCGAKKDAEIFESLCAEVERLRKGPWINPDDRLPKSAERVLFCVNGGEQAIPGRYEEDGGEGWSNWFRGKGSYYPVQRVIAWMPWPVAPKSREDINASD